MSDMISALLADILVAVYQPFWYSMSLAILYMFFYLYSFDLERKEQGFKNAVKRWIDFFRNSKEFRVLFYLVFYISILLFRVLLNRDMYLNPVSKILEGWWIYYQNANGDLVLTAEPIENVLLFIPVIFLWLYYLRLMNKLPFGIIRFSITRVFLCSLIIECLQLFLRVGTFQISDLVYNTLGGFIGAAIFCIFKLIKDK